MSSIEAYHARDAVQKLTESTKPGPAIRALLATAETGKASPFEQYAADVLKAAGAETLTAEGSPELRLIRSAGGQLVRLFTPTAPHAAHTAKSPMPSVQVLEDALNRLEGIASALSEGIGAQSPHEQKYARARRQKLFESRGMEYPLWSDTERGAHVQLPKRFVGETAANAFFNEIDWRMLDTVANNAHVFFQAAILTNLNQVIFGIKAPRWSEWDVRTRLASILGGLETSLRFSYTFDCDTSRNTAVVHFTVPPLESFPACPERASLEDARTVYALRLATLLGAACFGSGRVIDHAFAVGHVQGGKTVASCAFERMRFVHESLPVIDSGAFASPEMRFDPEQVALILSANHADYAMGPYIPPASGQLAGTRADPWEDDRELPGDLQRFFHAKRVRDIDTTHYFGGSAAVIDEAKADSDDLIVSAIAQLEGVVQRLESELTPPDELPDARPLYCEHAMARAAVALLDDELSVSSQAEAFLNPGLDDAPATLPDVYYYRAPDALFHAHVGLADLYRKLGDVHGAEAQADRCIALAPTTSAGYAMKADALAGQGRFKEAANVLMGGLQTAVSENDQALLLHDLAQLFWRMGRSRDASAVHIYTSAMTGIYAGKSTEFVKQLADGANVHDFIRANLQEAAQIVRAIGIPLITERMRQMLLAKAALDLANAQMPRAASPYIVLLAKHFPTNRAIVEACNSIQYGVS